MVECHGSTRGDGNSCEEGAVHGAGQFGLFHSQTTWGNPEKEKLWQIPRGLTLHRLGCCPLALCKGDLSI